MVYSRTPESVLVSLLLEVGWSSVILECLGHPSIISCEYLIFGAPDCQVPGLGGRVDSGTNLGAGGAGVSGGRVRSMG